MFVSAYQNTPSPDGNKGDFHSVRSIFPGYEQASVTAADAATYRTTEERVEGTRRFET
jgi:hypothetical protein